MLPVIKLIGWCHWPLLASKVPCVSPEDAVWSLITTLPLTPAACERIIVKIGEYLAHLRVRLQWYIFTARRSYASAVLGVVILAVCPSVCHTRALWLIQRTYQRYFIPHERAILLVFCHPTVVAGRRPLPPKVQSWRIESRTRAFQRGIDEVRTLPLSLPKSGSTSALFFFWIKLNFNWMKSVKKFLWQKTFSSIVIVQSFPI